jgi:predicted dienelactone hydrolase
MPFVRLRLALLLLLPLMFARPGWAQPQVGFALLHVADEAPEPPLRVALWYPAAAVGAAPGGGMRLGPYASRATPGLPVAGTGLPLVLISHGTAGNFASHHALGTALAAAGFVVAAPNHTGDTTEDASRAGTGRSLQDRVRHLGRVIDALLRDWPEGHRIDAGRIGAFGYSAGGFTVLVAAGGKPDLRRLGPHCALQPADPVCRLARPTGQTEPVAWPQDARIRAVVAAAPALGFAFAPRGLADVTVPVQLWRPEADEVLAHPWNAEMVRRLLPSPPETHVVPRAGHYVFIAPCPELLAGIVPEICIDPEGVDRAAIHAAMEREVVAFFTAKLAPR